MLATAFLDARYNDITMSKPKICWKFATITKIFKDLQIADFAWFFLFFIFFIILIFYFFIFFNSGLI